MTGLFHSDWLGYRPGSVSCRPTGGRGRDGKIRQPPPHRGELRVDLAGFLNSARVEVSRDTPSHLPVVQLLHSTADPGPIT
jgi:hypothetical protein